jgi:hypothetical protein
LLELCAVRRQRSRPLNRPKLNQSNGTFRAVGAVRRQRSRPILNQNRHSSGVHFKAFIISKWHFLSCWRRPLAEKPTKTDTGVHFKAFIISNGTIRAVGAVRRQRSRPILNQSSVGAVGALLALLALLALIWRCWRL